MAYRKLLAVSCRKCGDLKMTGDLKPDSHTWSGYQHVCKPCSRAADREYSKTPAGRKRWQTRQADKGAHTRYRAMHRRIVAARGKASDHRCYCGAQAAEWALLPFVHRLVDGPYVYSLDPDDFISMCRSHHRTWDHIFRRLRRK